MSRKRIQPLPLFAAKSFIYNPSDNYHRSMQNSIFPSPNHRKITNSTSNSRSKSPISHNLKTKHQKNPVPLARSFSTCSVKPKNYDETILTPIKERNQSVTAEISTENYLNPYNDIVNEKLNQKLASLTPVDKSKQFLICEEAFKEVIHNSKLNSGVLLTIKKGYDLYIDEKEMMIEDLKQELSKKHKSKSNSDLDTLKTQKKRYFEKKKMKTSELLMKENSIMAQKLAEMANMMKVLEKKIRYCERKHRQNSEMSSEIKFHDKSQENLKLKNTEIPKLDLSTLHSSKKNDDSFDVSSNLSLASSYDPTRKSLKLPAKPAGFQDEFMSKIHEFSESWRNLIQDQTRT